MATSEGNSSSSGAAGRRLVRAAQVVIVSSVMFSFISYWRIAAVVLCDLASTAYYIGGIVEQAIGPAAPWFILAVMIFSYAVRAIYIESCSIFVRGGVYRVVKQALGGFLAKLSVSALMFDYVLTGPTSGVSAGQYIVGLVRAIIQLASPDLFQTLHLSDQATWDLWKRWGSVLIATLITLYFFRQNLIGIHESSDKALKIMIATTIMGAIMLVWCAVTLIVQGPVNRVPVMPDLNKKTEPKVVKRIDPATGLEIEVWQTDEHGNLVPETDEQGQPVPKINEATGEQEDPLGFVGSGYVERIFPGLPER